jgi:steroid delta-isomerase-like uncharacterized protein
MATSNRDISRSIYEQVWSTGAMEIIDTACAPDMVVHDPASPPVNNAAAFKQLVKTYRDAFPDLQFTVEHQLVDGDMVVTRWTARGTHRGALMGVAPTGARAVVTGIDITRFKNGRMVEGWSNWDTAGLMAQLGAAPRPGASASAPTSGATPPSMRR